MPLDDRLADDAQALAPDLVRLRHRLHEYPEIGLDLPRTQQTVLEAIDGLGMEVTTGTRLSSVTAVLRGGRPGPAVLLRGDMDALPVTELTGVGYAEPVEVTGPDGVIRRGQVLEIDGSRVTVQVLDGTRGLGLDRTTIRSRGDTSRLAVGAGLLSIPAPKWATMIRCRKALAASDAAA